MCLTVKPSNCPGTKFALNMRSLNDANPCPPNTCVIQSPPTPPDFRSIFEKTWGSGTKLTRPVGRTCTFCCLQPSPFFNLHFAIRNLQSAATDSRTLPPHSLKSIPAHQNKSADFPAPRLLTAGPLVATHSRTIPSAAAPRRKFFWTILEKSTRLVQSGFARRVVAQIRWQVEFVITSSRS